MKLAATALFLASALCSPAIAQTFDNTGNSKLNGSYYFRELLFTSSDAIAAYGNITFNNGTFTIAAQLIDANAGAQQAYNTSGTYTISASGYGFISNPLNENQTPVYGLVGANGVFIGSSSESGDYDLFIAAPISSQSSSTLQGSYSLAYMDPTGALAGTPFDALVQMSPNGAGALGTVNLNVNAGASGTATQSISNVKYIVSNNAFVLQFPSSNSSQNLLQGSTYLYSTPDGNFVFGGSPLNFDMFVGVRTGSPSNFGGLYYQGGFDLDTSGSGSADTFYGSFQAISNGVILGHQRLQSGGAAAIGYTYSDSYPNGTTGNYTASSTNTQFIAGNGGAEIGLGIGSVLSISAAIPAPSFSPSGAYIYPTGVVNSASFAPFTAGVSPGEYITLFGTNIGLGNLQVASSIPLPTKLGGVQVLINNVPAPILYVSSTQVSVIVPYEITTSVAQIQVVNSGTTSNAVTELVNQTTPGVYTLTQNGIGYGATIHQDGSVVSPSHPAQIGETVSVFLTGLGGVFPSIADGAAAPSSTLSTTSNTIGVDIGGIVATVQFAGLAPGFVGLYQLNVTIPSGVTAGDNYLDIQGPDSFASEALISISGTSAVAVSANSAPARVKPRTRGSGFPLPGRSIITPRVKPL